MIIPVNRYETITWLIDTAQQKHRLYNLLYILEEFAMETKGQSSNYINRQVSMCYQGVSQLG